MAHKSENQPWGKELKEFQREFRIRLAKFRKRVPNEFWVIPLLICCVMLPFAIKVELVMPGHLDVMNKFFELLVVSPQKAFLFAYAIFSINAFAAIIIGGIFLFLRASLGYETRKINTLPSLARGFIYKNYRLALRVRLAKLIKPS